MKLLLALIVAAALLFVGCAGSQAPVKQPVTQPPVQPPVQNNTVPPAPPAPPAENKTIEPAPPAPESDNCVVAFQKDASNVYLVAVETSSGKQLTVRCPNGEMGEARGSLFLCTHLDVEAPVVAYLAGKECSSASFQRSAYEKKGSSKIFCSLSLSHSRLTVGESSEVNIQTSTGEKEVTLTYTCGTGTKTQKRSGLMTDGSNCQFNVPGTYAVEARIDGEVCDSKLIEVFENSHECFVLQDSMNYSKVGNDYVYTAKVAGRGYSSEDTLKYRCYDNSVAIKVGTFPSSTDFVATIECRSREGPMPEKNMSVRVGSDSCGTLSVPQ